MTKNGEIIKARDPLGNEITAPLTATYENVSSTVYRWYMGQTAGATTDPTNYNQICLPAGTQIQWTTTYTVKNTTPDNTTISTSVTSIEDSSANEDVTTNNSMSTSTIVYRPDVIITKTGRTLDGNIETLVANDDFNRANSTTVGGSWTESDASAKLSIINNQLAIGTGGASASLTWNTALEKIDGRYIDFTYTAPATIANENIYI